ADPDPAGTQPARRARLPAAAAARAAGGDPQVHRGGCGSGEGGSAQGRRAGAARHLGDAAGGARGRLIPPAGTPMPAVLVLADIGFDAPAALLARFGLALARVADGEPIPGSYWGESEAG